MKEAIKDIGIMVLKSTMIAVGWAFFLVILGMVLKVATALFLMGWGMFL